MRSNEFRRIACALPFGLIAAPITAYGQTAPTTYLEAGVGVTILQDVQTKTFTGTVDGSPVSIKGSLSYNPALAGGAEIGGTGFGGGWLRAGVSYDYLSLSLRRARITGTIDGEPVDESATRSELNSIGLSFDNNVHAFGGNVYANLAPIDATIQPYIGVGGGVALVQNANTVPAGSLTAGLRFPFGNGYVGVRYRLYYVEGPKDNLGIQYQSVVAHTFLLMFGTYFN